jgi:hypothetical protein
MALEAYRERRIAAYQLRTLLGIPSRFELDRLLKDRRIESYTAEDFGNLTVMNEIDPALRSTPPL